MLLIGEDAVVRNSTDMVVVFNAVIAFIIFIVLQIFVFRFIDRRDVLKWLVYLFGIGFVLSFGISGYFVLSRQYIASLGVVGTLGVMALPVIVYGMLSFCYVLCIFGPYESSIRLRIVREIDEAGAAGITWEKLLERYNARTILKIRLDRLVSSGELKFDGLRYHLNNRTNVFSLIADLSRGLKKIYNL